MSDKDNEYKTMSGASVRNADPGIGIYVNDLEGLVEFQGYMRDLAMLSLLPEINSPPIEKKRKVADKTE